MRKKANAMFSKDKGHTWSNETCEGGASKMVRVARVLVAVVSALALVSAVMGGCVGKGGSTGPKDVIYLGFVGPLTGPCAASGQQMLNGAKLAVKMLNEAGGVNGRRVELVVADDRADPKEAASIANKFVADNRIVAVAGHYNSSNVLASAPICAEGKLAMTHVGVSPNISRQTAPTMFRISVTAAAQAKDIAKWIFAEENLRSLAIIYENTDYGRGEGGALEREFQALGGNVCYKGLYQLGETKDFTGILTAMKGTNPQAAFISGGYTEAALIVKQAKGLGVNVPFFGSDGFYEEDFIRLAGDAAEGVRITGLYVPDDPDPDVQRFVSAFKAE